MLDMRSGICVTLLTLVRGQDHPAVPAPTILESLMHLVEPVKDLFLAIFFASVGG
jgi:Kef-type K+ transport system membrane component KefB